ncbi:HNH endonuclease [Paenibacillus sp. FSL H7-0357]|uniref:HNH endonuclease n=1 Tax=Paenibacillus sp. FSL H7-0357 TaxID=1536774 RepID=UPI0018CDA20A|nr:HNH endonuclease [Paenibacillus sp. FSL H7-0357]
MSPLKKEIFKNHKKNKTRSQRAEFPLNVVAELISESNGLCQVCFVSRGTQTHHIMPRSRSGRGVKENGLRVCNYCHKMIHEKTSVLNKYIELQREKYGENFWFDELDRIQYKEEA